MSTVEPLPPPHPAAAHLHLRLRGRAAARPTTPPPSTPGSPRRGCPTTAPSWPRPPTDAIWVGDARDMDRCGDVADNSVALVVTSPAVLRRQGVRGGPRGRARPGRLRGLPGHAPRRLQPVLRQARAGRAHRGQRGQPGPQALPVPVPRRHRPARAAGLPPAGRDRLAEEPRRRRLVRLGHLPATRQPGAARRVRADHRGLQGPLRPGPDPRRAARPGPPPRGHHHHGRVRRRHHRRLGHPHRVGHPGGPSGTLPGRAAPPAHRALHLPRRPGPRPVHGIGIDGRGRGAHRAALRRLRHRRGLRGPGRAAGGRGAGRRLRAGVRRTEPAAGDRGRRAGPPRPKAPPSPTPRPRPTPSRSGRRPATSPSRRWSPPGSWTSRTAWPTGISGWASTSGPGTPPAAPGCSSCPGPSRPPGPACADPTCCGRRWARPASCTRRGSTVAPGTTSARWCC